MTVIGDPTLRLMPARDIAVTNVSPSKTVVIQGDSLSINVTVENQGDTPETFNVTLYANSTATQIQNVTLIDRSNDTIIFVWDTTNFPRGNYTLSAYAWPVPRETETEDNLIVDGIVQITVLDNNPEVVRVNEISISIVFKGKFQGKPNSFSPTHCIIPFLGLFS